MKRGERSQILIEFALLTPILLLLIFVSLDIGLVLIRRATAEDAARVGATEAAAGVPMATVIAYTVDHSGGALNDGSVSVCRVDETHVRVSGVWTWRWLSGPLIARFGGSAVDLTLRPSADRRIDLDPGATPAAPTPDAPPCD